MEVVIDTSALIAVIVGEPERDAIVQRVAGATLIGPGSIPWEVGNAFSAMFKRKRLSLETAIQGLAIFEAIPIRYAKPDMARVLHISEQTRLYAYDAYFLDCAIRHSAPLLTLDRGLAQAAIDRSIEVLEL